MMTNQIEIPPTESTTIEQQFRTLLDLEPKLVLNFVASNAVEQKRDFIEGGHPVPLHDYDRLASLDLAAQLDSIKRVGANLLTSEHLPSKHREVYGAYIDRYLKMTELMHDAQQIAAGSSDDELTRRFMENNIELYGRPVDETYRALLSSKLEPIANKQFHGMAAELKEQLFDMVGYEADASAEHSYRPNAVTLEWMKTVVHTLYDGMLSHVPDQEKFTSVEVRDVFDAILRKEFGDVAAEWTIDLEEATSIDVKTPEKRVVVPISERMTSREQLRQLVVHEMGVHVLRGIAGGTTDLGPMETGLAVYYDSDEGLGVVMEQALKGEFKERGVPLYITAGMAYCDNKNFREVYEAKWRIAALSKCADGADVTEKILTSAKDIAYRETNRIFRGTDTLPWFKDLAYYNGSVNVWKHLDSICGDYDKFQFVLMGKADPSNAEHRRAMYETKTVE